MLRDTLPRGYRRTAGLLVPDDLPRDREVWTKDETKLLDRALTLLQAKAITLLLRCDDPKCAGSKMSRERNANGEQILRCDHKDRIFSRVH